MGTQIRKYLLVFTAIVAFLVVLLAVFTVFQPIGEATGVSAAVTAEGTILGAETSQVPIAGAFAGFTEYITGASVASLAGTETALGRLSLTLMAGAILMAAYTMWSRRKPIGTHEADLDFGFRRYLGNTSPETRYPDCGTVSQGALAGGD